MTDKSLESRIKKLEERFRDLKDSTEEATSSIEDLYDSLNNLKALPAYDSSITIPNNNGSDLSPDNSSGKSTDKSPSKNDIYRVLGKYNLLPSTETYILAERFGNLLLENLLPSKQQLIEMLEYVLTKSKEEQIEIYNKITNTVGQDCNALKYEKDKDKPKMLTILELGLSPYYRMQAICKLQMLEKMDTQDAEYCKLSQWMDNLLSIPFGKYNTPNYINTYLEGGAETQISKANANTNTKAKDILQTARAELDNVIYGQQATKTHILEIIARMISNPSTTGTVFAVEGVPGCGKTTLIKEGLSKILGLPFEFISLGGASESAYLAGQNYTYIGSGPGKIIQALKQAKCMNPIFYFDELDKVSNTERGQEVMNLLIHLTDPAQNAHFQDQYMDGIPVDLSRAIFVFSFNDRRQVNPILLDRMEVIRFHTYTPADKAVIIEKHLIPQIMHKYFGNAASSIKCIMKNKSKIMQLLVSRCSRISSGNSGIIKKKIIRAKSSGIRTIIRRIDKAIAKVNLAILESGFGQDIIKIRKIILTTKMFSIKANQC